MSAPKIQRMADSMASASSMWGLDKSEIMRAKAGGCTAFFGGRIDRKPLLIWLSKNPAPLDNAPAGGSKERKLRAEAERVEILVMQLRGSLIERATVTDEWGRHLTAIFDILDKSLDRVAYNAIAKEVKGYLGKYAGAK